MKFSKTFQTKLFHRECNLLSWLPGLLELPELELDDPLLNLAMKPAEPEGPWYEVNPCFDGGGTKWAELMIFCPTPDTASPPEVINWKEEIHLMKNFQIF